MDPISIAMLGTSLAGLFGQQSASKAAAQQAARNYALQQQGLALQQQGLDFTKQNAAEQNRFAQAGRTDPYGSTVQYDPATNQWITNLSPAQRALLSASQTEQLQNLTGDAALNRATRDQFATANADTLRRNSMVDALNQMAMGQNQDVAGLNRDVIGQNRRTLGTNERLDRQNNATIDTNVDVDRQNQNTLGLNRAITGSNYDTLDVNRGINDQNRELRGLNRDIIGQNRGTLGENQGIMDQNRAIRTREATRGNIAADKFNQLLNEYKYTRPPSEGATRDEIMNLIQQSVGQGDAALNTLVNRQELRQRGNMPVINAPLTGPTPGQRFADMMLQARQQALQETQSRNQAHDARYLPALQEFQRLSDLGTAAPYSLTQTMAPTKPLELTGQQSLATPIPLARMQDLAGLGSFTNIQQGGNLTALPAPLSAPTPSGVSSLSGQQSAIADAIAAALQNEAGNVNKSNATVQTAFNSLNTGSNELAKALAGEAPRTADTNAIISALGKLKTGGSTDSTTGNYGGTPTSNPNLNPATYGNTYGSTYDTSTGNPLLKIQVPTGPGAAPISNYAPPTTYDPNLAATFDERFNAGYGGTF